MQDKSEMFTNKVIAELLRSIAAVYILTNEIRFKVIAYQNAADAVEHMTRELHDIWQEGKFKGIPGIGPTITQHLDEYFSSGRSKHFDEVLKGFPSTVFMLMRVPGIGAKTAFKMVKEFDLINPQTIYKDLQHIAQVGKIAELEGFGEKSQKEIFDAVGLYLANINNVERMPMPYAFALAQELEEYLRKFPAVKRIDFLGSFRRRVSTIGDIDVAVSADKKDSEKIVEHFIKFPRAVSMNNKGPEKASIIVSPHIRIDLRVQEERTYGSMLQYFTGSKSHNIKLREYAMKKGLSLNEYGIKDVKTNKVHEFKGEESFYGFLGLPYIPPEIREGTTEIQAAIQKRLPDLIEEKDLKGDLHIHSSYDLKPSHDMGANTYVEIVQKAKERGYSYIGFADHNPNITRNSKSEIIEIMKKRQDDIKKMFKNEKFPYFIGLEVDIQPNGELALPEEAIPYIDYLIVSVHSAFRQDIKEMTTRVLKGLSYPKVKIFGHPTARLLGKRPGIDLDWDQIFEFVKKKNIALEVNSGPERLDLPDTLVRAALHHSIKLIVDTDAHATEWMDGIHYGVSVARRGWATKNDIMNARSYQEFKNWILH